MARRQNSSKTIDIDAVVHAVEDDAKPELAIDRVAEAVAAGHDAAALPDHAEGAADTSPVAIMAAEPAPIEPASPTPIPSDTKDTPIMAEDTITNDTAQTAHAFAGSVQDRMKAFYERSTGLASEMTDLGRGNVEAATESGRILASGLQDLSRTVLEDTRSAFETMTADVKRMAAATSPTELLQVQSDVARRNLDAWVNHGSKTTEAMLKLANDAFAPVASRMSVAAEKLTKAA